MSEKEQTIVDPKHDGGNVSVSDGDAALQFLNNGTATVMTEADEKRLLRKIDRTIMPLMFACYFLQYLDKTLINYANVMGLQKDTGINTDQYSQLALIFYVSYLVFEFPTGYLMQRLPTSKYLGFNVCAWGMMVACTAAANSWAGLVTLRVLLGCFEAVVAPSLILITTMWYRKSEQPPRVGLWYVGTGIGKMVGALTSFGFQHYTGNVMRSWQIMFLVFGLITVAVGILVVLFMPDSPMKSRLTQEEKVWAIERLRGNKTGVENKHLKKYQVYECFRDPQTFLLVLIVLSSNIPNGFISSYQASVIQSFGFTSKQAALLSIPSGAVACFATITGTWFAGRFNLRGPFILATLGMGFLGSNLMAFLPEDGYVVGKMIGNYSANFIGSSLPLMYSYAGANYAGHTKKVTMNAVVLISFCLGNIIGPLTFREQDKPRFIPAKIAMVVTTAFAALLTVVLMLYYRWENKRRDQKYAHEAHRENSEFFDLTDRENHEFRFVTYPLPAMGVRSHTVSDAAAASNISGLPPRKKQTKLASIFKRISPSKNVYPANIQQAYSSLESVDTIDELKDGQQRRRSAGKFPSYHTYSVHAREKKEIAAARKARRTGMDKLSAGLGGWVPERPVGSGIGPS
ncbi:hypothetical protein MCOR02_007597 [Pyricularia oryzae]|nr:hypothetical protein MCOR02_007597 [Pyricularia oryzae]KAI6262716.1 hypothetical protein MCOR19_001057 [Pyricularia oryzae]KAI6316652.1 hypothetical protein MCOR34_004264 [Pyricularia oryzae]KAI6503271.1 hypothetical protein MCOR11_000873 [Pyricularia oryzae]KAI6561001.1 hypothetical protein MCOR03_004102 [Pyricularia oryzae]